MVSYAEMIGYCFLGVVTGIVLGEIRAVKSESSVVRFALAIVFLLPFTYLVIQQLLMGIAVFVGLVIGLGLRTILR